MNYSEDQKNYFYNEMNERLRNDLKKKCGADFREVSKEVSPEIENRFLNQIKEFEEKWETAETQRVSDILENTSFKKLDEIDKTFLKDYLKDVLSVYAAHNINVDIIEEDEVSDEEFYKFLTEELPEHEDCFVSLEGMTTNYIYEEFHPSDKLDARKCAEWFLFALVNRDIEEIMLHISKDRELKVSDLVVDTETFIQKLFLSVEGLEDVLEKKVDIKFISLSAKNIIEANLRVQYLESLHVEEQIFPYRFELVKSKYGGFEICGFEYLS